MTKTKISKLKVNDLKCSLNKMRILSTGKKSELVDRLKHALNSSYVDIDSLSEDQRVKPASTKKKYKYIDCLNQKLKFLEQKVLKLEKKLKNVLTVNKKCIQQNVKNAVKQEIGLKKYSSELKHNIVTKKCKEIGYGINTHTSDTSNQGKDIDTSSFLSKNTCNNILNKIMPTNKISNTRRNVLILSDSHGRGCAEKMQEHLGNNFQIQCWFKPNSNFEKVTESIIPLTNGFTKNDFVIIMMAGGNNALKGNKINKNSIENVMKCSNFTNLFLVSIPIWQGRPVLNQLIYNLNLNFYHLSNEYSNVFIDVNDIISPKDYVRHGLHLNVNGKEKICKYVSGVILQQLQLYDEKYYEQCKHINYNNLKTIVPSLATSNGKQSNDTYYKCNGLNNLSVCVEYANNVSQTQLNNFF
ncbi:hypothetical protein RN001_011498 [Aquatica leii]|uniref:SAP domain-containing protein n=1 Tax=Aquatica leii TaxID=1421715 RepID=A0AAN7P5T3_9COLE|nr:hypothetical protein RN001_011498 [Aquatica leii]